VEGEEERERVGPGRLEREEGRERRGRPGEFFLTGCYSNDWVILGD
jgi:hypothetical protein